MKKFFSDGFSAFCCLLLLFFCGCKKDQGIRNPPQSTILQYIAQDKQLTFLQAAIVRSKLEPAFSSGGPFTFFAPVDSAFRATGWTLDSIRSYDPVRLGSILGYHILSGRFSSNDITGFLTENVSSMDTAGKPFITKNYYGFFYDGVRVTDGNIELGDGVVQKLGSLTPPPAQTVLQLIDSLPELSYFAAAVNIVPQFQNLFSSFPQGLPIFSPGAPGFTVLAPTNAAFRAFGYPTVDSVKGEQPDVLYSLFVIYILNGFQFTPDFMGGWYFNYNGTNKGELTQRQGYAIDKDGVTIRVNYPTGGGSAATVPRIIRPNIVGTNGMIHEIDQIFVP